MKLARQFGIKHQILQKAQLEMMKSLSLRLLVVKLILKDNKFNFLNSLRKKALILQKLKNFSSCKFKHNKKVLSLQNSIIQQLFKLMCDQVGRAK